MNCIFNTLVRINNSGAVSETGVKGRVVLAFVVGVPVSDRFCRVWEETWWTESVRRGALMAVDSFPVCSLCYLSDFTPPVHVSVESVTYPLNLQPKT